MPKATFSYDLPEEFEHYQLHSSAIGMYNVLIELYDHLRGVLEDPNRYEEHKEKLAAYEKILFELEQSCTNNHVSIP